MNKIAKRLCDLKRLDKVKQGSFVMTQNDIKNNTSSLVFSETKKLVLEQYFLKLIEDDADIETIIKFK